jgi:Tfp pilus assembly protein PilN
MIKVNLLDSVTDRTRGATVVEKKVSDPRTRFWILGACVFALMALGMAFDSVSANADNARVKAELEVQEQKAAQMAAINKEQAELEKKMKNIETRIEAIKKLRATQQGPVSLLSAINERLPTSPDFRLETIEQKNGELTIEGHSPNEAAVTQFGRSLEFSSGAFSNVNLETERKELTIDVKDYDKSLGQIDTTLKPETVRFKIKCRYTPHAPVAAPQGQAGVEKAPANQVARR